MKMNLKNYFLDYKKVSLFNLLLKFMDLLNMINRAQINEFYKKVEKGKHLYFDPQFRNLVIF